MLSSTVSWTSTQGCRWSCWIARVCEQRELVQAEERHSRATFCAALGPRPRFVTLPTSTPLVRTSLTIDSPSRFAGDPGGHRTHAGDLTELVALDPATHESLQVDT
jgi:hypothetical protein